MAAKLQIFGCEFLGRALAGQSYGEPDTTTLPVQGTSQTIFFSGIFSGFAYGFDEKHDHETT